MSELSRWQPEKETDLPAFPLALLGYQRKAVDLYLQDLLESSGADLEVIELPPSSTPSHRLDRYQELGKEIGDLLSAVQETAVAIRDAAETDAARWREEATLEVRNRVAEAQATAEQLREAAWEVSTQMIAQLQEMKQKAFRSLEKDSQEIIAEAENEAHHIREEARRRADGIRRNAHVEALELEERSRELSDQMIDSAEQKVAAIQERVLALERHRDQLLEEIGGVRSGKTPIGVKLMDQSGGLVFPDQPEEEETVHVTPRYEMSGLVKVITPSKQTDHAASQSTTSAEDAISPPDGGEQSEEQSADHKGQPADSPFDDLFASLRQAKVSSSRSARRATAEPTPDTGEVQVTGDQSIELREEMLLSVSNHFLRVFKRLLTEEQNRVLEGLRTGELAWGVEEVEARLRSHLETLVEQSWQAGHRAAEKLTGRDLPQPDVVMGEDMGFTAQLVAEVAESMGPEDSSEPSQRARAASRTFRVWRSEKLERLLREISESYYQEGLSESLGPVGAAP